NSFYTIQLLSSTNQISLSHYARDNDLEANTYIEEKIVNDTKWYTINYGKYQTQYEAQQALARLPKLFRDKRAWIRKVTQEVIAPTQQTIFRENNSYEQFDTHFATQLKQQVTTVSLGPAFAKTGSQTQTFNVQTDIVK